MFEPLVKITAPFYEDINDTKWPPNINNHKLKKLQNIKSKVKLNKKLTVLAIIGKVLSLISYFCAFLWILFACFIGVSLLKQDINPKYQIDMLDTLMLIGCLGFFYFLTLFLRYLLSVSKYKTEIILSKLDFLNKNL